MILKDFLWFLLKDNLIINWIYIYCFPFLFRKSNLEVNPVSGLTTKYMLINSSSKRPFFAIKSYTSGTTNHPMIVYRSFKSILLEEYMFKTFLKRNGAPLNSSIAVIRGDMIKNINDNCPPFWIKLPFTGRTFFSSFHLSSANAQAYLEHLELVKPSIILAYPSSITFLARQAKILGWKPNWKFFGVFTSSETFSTENQQLCRDVFGNLFDHYGQAERVAALQQCRFGNYHVRDDYSYVEFITDDVGIKIVGSNYHNKAMKLIRYDTGDYVEGMSENGNCPCGDTSRYVIRIIGRDDDYVVLPDGRHIGRLDVAFKAVDGLLECQLVQTSSNTLEVNYVPLGNIDNSLLEFRLREVLLERLGTEMQLFFVLKLSIERTKAGKFRSVIRI